MLEARFFEAGACKHPGFSVMRGAGLKAMRFPALVGAIKHPQQGWLLFDSGYSQRFFAETRVWPFELYALTTPVELAPGASAVEQLAAAGIPASEIRHILVSHFHADHIGGLRDFPGAKFICLEEAWLAVRDLKGLRALMAGYLRGLLPDDFEERCRLVRSDELKPVNGLPGDWKGFDIFGDGLLQMVALPGHAGGHAGLFFDKTFLIGDAVWLSESLRSRRKPSALARIIMHEPHEFDRCFEALADLWQSGSVTLVPSHCSEALARLPRLSAKP